MKPFKFTLQALRTLRQRQENAALEAYAAALVNRARAAEALGAAEQALNSAQGAWQQQAQAGCPGAQMARHALHCQELALRRNGKLAGLGEAERKVNTVLKEMLAARQQREAVDQFFARQRRAYDTTLARAEQKFLDELAQRRPDFGLAASLEPMPAL